MQNFIDRIGFSIEAFKLNCLCLKTEITKNSFQIFFIKQVIESQAWLAIVQSIRQFAFLNRSNLLIMCDKQIARLKSIPVENQNLISIYTDSNRELVLHIHFFWIEFRLNIL